MTAPTIHPPAELPRDEAQGIYVALVFPWNEPIEDPFDRRYGQSLGRDQVKHPKFAEHRPMVNVDHNRSDWVGDIIAAADDETGMWVSVRLDKRGRELIAQGYTRVSGECNAQGRLVGIALCGDGEPAFRSAHVVQAEETAEDAPVSFVNGGRILAGPGGIAMAQTGWLAAVRQETNATGSKKLIVNVGGIKTPGPPEPLRVVADGNRAREHAYAFSPQAFLDDMQRDRQRFESWRESLAQAERDAVAAQRFKNGALPHMLTAEREADIERAVEAREYNRTPGPTVAETLALAAQERAAFRLDLPAEVEKGHTPWLSRIGRALSFRRLLGASQPPLAPESESSAGESNLRARLTRARGRSRKGRSAEPEPSVRILVGRR
jgi:hypothetical protein